MAKRSAETGIQALFTQSSRDYSGQFTSISLAPNLTLLESSFPGGGSYYVEVNGTLRAYESWDHEMGDTLRWTIDSDGQGPLFTAYWDNRIGARELQLGFKSRGIVSSDPKYFSFPEVKVNYKRVGSLLVFDGIDENPYNPNQHSISTGEVATLSWKKMRKGSILVSSRSESGVVEKMQFPNVVKEDLVGAIRNDTTTIKDAKAPYLLWQQQLGAVFLKEVTQ